MMINSKVHLKNRFCDIITLLNFSTDRVDQYDFWIVQTMQNNVKFCNRIRKLYVCLLFLVGATKIYYKAVSLRIERTKEIEFLQQKRDKSKWL